jgi:LacI family transcriptional regulator
MTKLTTMSPSVTSRDVARQAQVSVGTVFRVLNNEPTVDTIIRDRVLKAIDYLGYVHVPKKKKSDQLGTGEDESADKPKLKTVLFCVPLLHKPASQDAYYYQTLRGAQAACFNNSINLTYTTLPDSATAAEEAANIVHRSGADGLIVLGFSSAEVIAELTKTKIPMVVIDPFYPIGLAVDSVSYEALDGAILAMRYLLQLGHTQIAHIRGPKRYSMQRRLEGYRTTLEEAGIEFRPDLVVESQLNPDSGAQAVEELFRRGQNFSAIFCANDYVALGAIRQLNARGLRVPQDISVVGFDDLDVAALLSPSLTTIHANLEAKGSVAVQRLLERVAQPNAPVLRSIVQVHLVERASTVRSNLVS